MPRPKEPLIRPEEVIATALEVIDRDGLEGFNIRRLAQETGVNPSSLYHHFHDKNEILNRVCQRVFTEGRVVAPLRVNAPWQEYVKKSAARYRRALMRHPNVAPLLTPRPPLGRFGDSLGRRAIAKLLDEGVSVEYVYAIVDSINSLAYGSAMLNPQASDRQDTANAAPPNNEETAVSEALRTGLRSPDALFEIQIDALLTGWTSIVERHTGDKKERPSSTTRAKNRNQ